MTFHQRKGLDYYYNHFDTDANVMTLHRKNRPLNRLMTALLVLVIAVVGPVQASIHAGAMASQDLSGMQHSHHVEHHDSIATNTDHTHSDSPCAELCLQVSLVPRVNIAPSVQTSTSAPTMTAGVPLSLAEPSVPPPRNLF
ncbi:MAG: hypothetical protein JXQ97_11950 [Natronospirillum sp.]